MRSDGPCDPCMRGAHSRLQAIGEEVQKDQAFGQGFDRSRLEFAQCATCGSVWMTATETGPGDAGRDREEQVRICLTRGII